MTRQTKTPAQRAQEAYDVAARVASRLQKQHAALVADADRVGKERDAAFARRDFLARHPDLPKNQPTESGDTE